MRVSKMKAGFRRFLTAVLLMGTLPVNAEEACVIESYEPQKVTQNKGRKIVVLVGGCFDILHFGHIEFLKKAKAEGDFLIVALEPDEKISLFKKRRPTHTQAERAQNLGALRFVDQVLLLPELKGFEDYNRLVQDIRPDMIAMTADDPFIRQKQVQADGVGARLKVVVDRIKNFSSSNIHKSICGGE